MRITRNALGRRWIVPTPARSSGVIHREGTDMDGAIK
jgi:hypothetical protein